MRKKFAAVLCVIFLILLFTSAVSCKTRIDNNETVQNTPSEIFIPSIEFYQKGSVASNIAENAEADSLLNFKIKDSIIYTPYDTVFIPKGVNINDPGLWENRDSVQDIEKIVNIWHFNTIRLDISETFFSIDKIIEEFTKRQVVVVLGINSFRGTYPSSSTTPTLQETVDKYKKLAEKYTQNPYVWFNIIFEPGSMAALNQEWLLVHEEIIKAVRGTGCRNIIICEGHGFGSELTGTTEKTIKDKDSAIITYGPELIKKYENIMFSLNVTKWTGHTTDKLSDFVTRIQNKNLTVIFTGLKASMQGGMLTQSFYCILNALKVSVNKNTGWIYNSWEGEDGYGLTFNNTKQSEGFGIIVNDEGIPENLSWAGSRIWNDSHYIYQSLDSVDVGITGLYSDASVFEHGKEYSFMAVVKNLGDKVIKEAKINVDFYLNDRIFYQAVYEGAFGMEQAITVKTPPIMISESDIKVSVIIDPVISYDNDQNTKNNKVDLSIRKNGESKLLISDISIVSPKETYGIYEEVYLEAMLINKTEDAEAFINLKGSFYVNGVYFSTASINRSSSTNKEIFFTSSKPMKITDISADIIFKILPGHFEKDNFAIFKTISFNMSKQSIDLIINGSFNMFENNWNKVKNVEFIIEEIKNQSNVMLKIKKGESGCIFQPLELQPNTAYALSAKGFVDSGEGNIGVKYILPDSSIIYENIKFDNTTLSEKRIIFTTPPLLESCEVYIIKKNSDNTFIADDISLRFD